MTKCILLILFAFTFFSANSQHDLKFKRYTTNQGLIHNDILCICQDHLGFMWFGTKKGCSRFDGIEFKTYEYNENSPGSIAQGWVNKIITDNKNGLWFAIAGSGSTLMRYDYETNQFIDFGALIKVKLNKGNEGFGVWSVFCDSEGLIWFFAINTGVIRYNPLSQNIKTFDNYRNLSSSLSVTRGILEDADHNIWFATSQGVFVYNKSNDSFTSFKNNPNDKTSISSNNCNSIFRNSDDQIWIGTNVGLNKVVQSSGTFSFERFVHDPQNSYSLSNNLVYDIAEDTDNNLLIATVNGLCLMDKKNRKIYTYHNDEMDNESINSNIVRSVYCDKYSNVWVGTSSGIGKLQIKNFKTYSHSSYKNSISHNKVECLYETPDSNIWIATPRGIDIFSRNKEQFTQVLGITQNKKGLYGTPITLHPNVNQGIWIGTHNGGLSYFNYSAHEMKNYITDSIIQFPNNIFSIFKDTENNLWFDNQGKGVFVCDLELKRCKLFSHDKENKNTLSSNWPRIIMEDSESNLWIGTVNGLNKLTDFEAGTFVRYLDDLEVYCIVETSDKLLWVGTNKGLFQINKSGQQLNRYTSSDGLPNSNVFGIVEDQDHNLWVSTDKDLVKFKQEKKSQTEITVYREDEGVAIGNFIPRSYARLADGSIMFGGTEGFLMFHPAKIKNDTVPPHIVFTELKVMGEAVKVGQKISNQIILQKSITITQQLVLNHKNNAFSIEFAGLQHNLPQHYQYCYRLDGYDAKDSNWHYAKASDREVEYMNLPRGNYTFKVKAANSHGVWNDKITELKITILPPWWKTFGFKTLWGVLLLLSIYIIVKIRTYNLQQQKRRLEEIVEQRTTELKEMNVVLKEGKEELEVQMEQMAKMNEKLEIKTIQIENMAKQLHEADQSKLRFFANISHEFRTPLSLIIGPLEKYLNTPASDLVKVKGSYLKLMHQNAKRLHRLINEIIDFRKIDQGEKKLRVSNNNIEEFIKEIADAFSTHAESKNIDLRYTVEDLGFKKANQLLINSKELVDLSNQKSSFYNNFWFDPGIMEKILYNLISNAIKYTKEGGTVNVELIINNEKLENKNTDDKKLLTIHSSLFIKVSDTGIGIDKDNLDKIFDRFYRVEAKESYAEDGAGIGLSYTKELIELHKGIISVESEYGKGSNFILQFPMGREHFEKNAIVEESTGVKLDYIHSMIDSTEEGLPEVIESERNDENKVPILLVEDNKDLRRFIKGELESKYNILEAENGEQGWNIAFKASPHLIISDIMMPVMNGISLCKKIKTDENTSHIPVILLTAKTGDENTIKGLETGADDYITKPFNINVLKMKINNLFQLRRQMREKFSKSIDVAPSEIGYSLIDKKFMEKAIEVVHKNIGDANFDNDAFINNMDSSRTLVYTKIKTLTGQSISEFIRGIRLKAAAKLFIEGNNNIAEVCYGVGFKHQTFFTRHFSKMFGKTPGQFIKEKLKK